MVFPTKCKCGADARTRNSGEYVWVECKKKCGMRTGVYREISVDVARLKAVSDWNRLVKKDG